MNPIVKNKKKMYENPRRKDLLIDSFITEFKEKEVENHCHYSGLPSPSSYEE